MTSKHWVFLMAGLLSLPLAAQDQAPAADPFSATVGLGYHDTAVDGSRQRAGLYVEPYSAWYLDLYDLDLRTASGFDFADAAVFGLGGPQRAGELTFWNRSLPAMLRAEWERASFYGEPSAPLGAVGSRSRLGVEARVRPAAGWLLRGDYQRRNLAQPVTGRGGQLDYATQDANGSVAMPLWGGDLEVGIGSQQFRDDTGYQPDSHAQRYYANYSATAGARVAWGAQANWLALRQPGQRPTDLFQAGLQGYYQPASDIWLDARLQFRDLNYGITQNGYVSKLYSGAASATYRPARQWRLKSTIEHSVIHRLNAVKSGVDKPRETRLAMRADYRPRPGLQASAEYQYTTISDLPSGAAPDLFSRLPLLFDVDHRMDLRASATVGRGSLVYGFWQYRRRESDARQVNHDTHQFGAGATCPLGTTLSFSGDLFYRTVDSNWVELDRYDADSLVTHLGLGYVPTARLNFGADYYRVETYEGGPDADLDTFSLYGAWSLRNGHSLRVGFNREIYDNNFAPGQDYGANALDLSYVAKF